MIIRMFIIKILIKSLWRSYYPVNCLRIGFDKTLQIFEGDNIKHPFKKIIKG